jgi:hypothetical protein
MQKKLHFYAIFHDFSSIFGKKVSTNLFLVSAKLTKYQKVNFSLVPNYRNIEKLIFDISVG